MLTPPGGQRRSRAVPAKLKNWFGRRSNSAAPAAEEKTADSPESEAWREMWEERSGDSEFDAAWEQFMTGPEDGHSASDWLLS